MESARLLNPHPSAYLCFLLLALVPGVPAATAASYSSRCHFPVLALDDLPAEEDRTKYTKQPTYLPHISTGHFSGGADLRFAPDRSYFIRSFSFFPRNHVRTTDPAVLHVFATLILERSGLDGHREILFELEGYYSAATSCAELCMVGSGSYARDDGVRTKVLLPDIALRLHVPRPSNLSRPFITGSLEGAEFGAVTLGAYADSDDCYVYTPHAAFSCPAPPVPLRDGRHVLNAGFSCSRLISLLRGAYTLDYKSHLASNSLLRLRHRRMHVNQMSCTAEGSVRAYIAFYADRSDSFPANHSVEWRDSSLFLVGDDALVADGFWDSSQSQLCLTACRVVRSGPSRADLAVGECGIGVSFWFPAVWSFRDKRTVAGLIWNATSQMSGGDAGKTSSGEMIWVSRTMIYTYTGDLSDVKYNYTRVEEATKHYRSNSSLSSAERKAAGRFPGSSCRDFAYHFSLKKQFSSGSASPVAIGSTLLEGDRLMDDDGFSRRAAAEVNNQSLLNVSYYFQYQVRGVSPEMRHQERRIMAEGVYDTTTGFMCMVACQEVNGLSDCEVMVTVQFAPMDGEVRDRAVGTISSLRKQSDPLFFEALDFVADGMYRVQMAELRWRTDVEEFMVLFTMALSSVLIALQLRHAKKHREALPATSVTMLVILALGYLTPLLLNFENTVLTRRELFFQPGLSNTGGFALRASTMLAFVLQLRLLQFTLSERRSTEAAAATEKNTLRVCLPLYFVGAVLMLFVNRGDGRARLLIDATEPTLADVLTSYGGLILDAFLLPQVILNACSGSNARALSPWFYVGGTVSRAAPHLYNVLWSPRDGLFGVAWEVAILCGSALLPALLFLQQRLGSAFMCCLMRRRSSRYGMVTMLSS